MKGTSEDYVNICQLDGWKVARITPLEDWSIEQQIDLDLHKKKCLNLKYFMICMMWNVQQYEQSTRWAVDQKVGLAVAACRSPRPDGGEFYVNLRSKPHSMAGVSLDIQWALEMTEFFPSLLWTCTHPLHFPSGFLQMSFLSSRPRFTVCSLSGPSILCKGAQVASALGRALLTQGGGR